MRKVCEVYLVSNSASDERGVELTFPVSQYEMMDAFEQIRTKSPGDVYWQVEEFYSPSKILLQSELIYKIVASALLCHEFSECSRFCELTIFQNKNGIKLIHKMCEGGKTKHRYSFEADANQSKEEGAGIIVEQCLPSRLAFDRILNEMVHHGKSKKVFFKTHIFGKRPQQSHRGLHGRQ